MKNILLVVVALAITFTSQAQITLEHSYTAKLPNASGSVVIFSANGTKYLMTDTGTNQIKLYNTDHTLWKSIPASVYTGYKVANVFAVSDNLFNSDNLVELAVSYSSVTGGAYKCEIINESGAILKDLGGAWFGNVKKIGEVFKLMVWTPGTGYIYDVYSLPGTIPCNSCATVGLAKEQNNDQSSFLSNPIPNPNSGEVTIHYELPEGKSTGVITVINANGEKVMTNVVSNKERSLIVNTSKLSSGVYYYYLTGEGIEPSSNKMVIVH